MRSKRYRAKRALSWPEKVAGLSFVVQAPRDPIKEPVTQNRKPSEYVHLRGSIYKKILCKSYRTTPRLKGSITGLKGPITSLTGPIPVLGRPISGLKEPIPGLMAHLRPGRPLAISRRSNLAVKSNLGYSSLRSVYQRSERNDLRSDILGHAHLRNGRSFHSREIKFTRESYSSHTEHIPSLRTSPF